MGERRFTHIASFYKTAANPATNQGWHPKDQGWFRGNLAAPQIWAKIAQRHQGDHQQRQGYRLPGWQSCTTDQKGHQQDRAAGSEHGEQETDQGPTRCQQKQHRRDHMVTLFHGMAASRRAMPQKPVIPANIKPAPTKPLSQIQPGASNWLRSTPISTKEPAVI